MGTKTWQILAPSLALCTPEFLSNEEFFRDDYLLSPTPTTSSAPLATSTTASG
jgi:hypothetical protein